MRATFICGSLVMFVLGGCVSGTYDPGWTAPEAIEVEEGKEGGEEGGEAVPCDQQQRAIEALLREAQACSPESAEPQCAEIIEGICCPEVVTDRESEATKTFLLAVEKFKGGSCEARCPVSCLEPSEVNACDALDDGGGRCRIL